MAEGSAKSKAALVKTGTSLMGEPSVAAGRFATNVAVSMADDYSVLTFIADEPLAASEKTAHMVARIYMTLPHMRKLAKLLDDKLKALDAKSQKAVQKKPNGHGA